MSGPLSMLRRAVLSAAPEARGRAKRGPFQLLLLGDATAPPRVLGFCADTFLGENLGVRRGESLLVLDAGVGLVGMHGNKAGATVWIVTDERHRRAAERSVRGAQLFAKVTADPSSVAGETFDVIAWCSPLAGTDSATLDGVLARARPHLHRGSRILLALPESGGQDLVPRCASDQGMRFSVIAHERRPVVGAWNVYEVWMPRAGEPTGEIPRGDALNGARWVLKDR